jgi:adenosylcobyric acid synthase
MLGRAIADPHHVESGDDEAGLGLLPVVTTLGREKITRRVRAGWRPDGPGFEGYEIHAGVTAGPRPLLDVEGHPEGSASADGRVRGTHLHGLFEPGPARRHALDRARSAAAERPRRLVSVRKFFARGKAGGYHSLSPPCAAVRCGVCCP